MNTFGVLQLLVDVVLLFLILVMLAGRAWRKGRGGSDQAERDSYRDMVTTLSQLLAEMKDELSVLQDRLVEKQAELRGVVAAADERLERLRIEEAERGAAPRVPRGPSFAAGPAPRAAEGPAPRAAAAPAVRVEPAAEDDRRERYRRVLEFSEKGWSALDIARVTQLPRGEVELLIRTKGRRT